MIALLLGILCAAGGILAFIAFIYLACCRCGKCGGYGCQDKCEERG